MKIAVFGSAFDPPHRGHELMIRALLANQLADQVWLLPVGRHASGKDMESAHHRLAMLNLIIRPGIRIILNELNQPTTSYTYYSLVTISQQNPDHFFSFVIGADKLVGFSNWVEYDSLLESFPVWVFPRRGFALRPLYAGMTVIQAMKPLEVSSTLVKDCIKAGYPLHGLVNNRIAEYIAEHNLYRLDR